MDGLGEFLDVSQKSMLATLQPHLGVILKKEREKNLPNK